MKANKRFNTGVITFTFTNEDDEVFSSFKMNPTDINLVKRAEEVSEFFSEKAMKAGENATAAELAEINAEIEEKINYLLGYDAREEIFGNITATTVSEDGEIFANVLFEFILEKIQPEIEKRKQKMQAGVNKYTEKYLK